LAPVKSLFLRGSRPSPLGSNQKSKIKNYLLVLPYAIKTGGASLRNGIVQGKCPGSGRRPRPEGSPMDEIIRVLENVVHAGRPTEDNMNGVCRAVVAVRPNKTTQAKHGHRTNRPEIELSIGDGRDDEFYESQHIREPALTGQVTVIKLLREIIRV